jgi:hypothetical protein
MEPLTVNPLAALFQGARQIGRTAPAFLVGLAGPDSPARQVALRTLQAMGYATASCYSPLQAEAAERWCVDARTLLPGAAGWEAAVPEMSAARCADPFFRAWAARRGQDLEAPRSPRWAVMHWSLFRRESDPWVFVRQVEVWLISQRAAGRHHVVLVDLHTTHEYQLLAHWGGRTLQVSERPIPSPLGPHDAWISTADPAHVGQRLTDTVPELFDVALRVEGTVQ